MFVPFVFIIGLLVFYVDIVWTQEISPLVGSKNQKFHPWMTTQTTVLTCGPGNYSMSGATICSVCPAGTFASIGATICTLCPTNTFNPYVGQSTIYACQQCGAGKISSLGSRKCSYSSSVVAGFTSLAGSGGDNGPATLASFNSPSAIAFDPLFYNVMYVVDTYNHVIRTVDLNSGTITLFAGIYGGHPMYAYDGYPATQAYFYYPQDVKVDLSGNVYVADSYHHQIRKIDAITKTISTCAGYGMGNVYSALFYGFWGFNGDGMTATYSYLYNPSSIALDVSGNMYIADTNNGRIRFVGKFSGGVMTTLIYGITNFGINGWSPSSVAVDSTGTYVYVTETLNDKIYKLTTANIYPYYGSNGGGVLSTFSVVAGGGSTVWTMATSFAAVDRVGTSVSLSNPTGVILDRFGNLYFSDTMHGMVGVLNNVTGMVSIFMGSGYPGYHGYDGPATQVSLNNPSKIAFDPLGNFYVADQSNGRIRKAAIGMSAPSCPPGQAWYSSQCVGCCVCAAGYYCPGDNYQHVCPVNTYSAALGATMESTCLPCPSGTFSSLGSSSTSSCTHSALTVVAGNPTTPGNTGDGGMATSATMFYPHDVAVDSSNNLYILDLQYKVVRKVSSTTGIVTTVAGNGSTCTYGISPGSSVGGPYMFTMNARYQNSSSCGDGGAATSATFNDPYGIAVDVSGNLFIADRGNLVVRKVTATTGIISTVAGHGYQTSYQQFISYYSCPASTVIYQTCYSTCCITTCCNSCYYNAYMSSGYNCRACGSYCCQSSSCNPYPCNPYTSGGICSNYYIYYSAGGVGDGGAATSAYLNSPSGDHHSICRLIMTP